MTYRTITLTYPTHYTAISHDRDQGRVLCWKHDRSHCDFAEFMDHDLEHISLYIMQPLPTETWAYTPLD
jgi:hypothetical protein